MAEKRTYTCDHCGAEKRETNHWFVVLHNNCVLTIVPFASPAFDTARISEGCKVAHLCGANCASKKVSEYLAAPHAIPVPEGAPKQ